MSSKENDYKQKNINSCKCSFKNIFKKMHKFMEVEYLCDIILIAGNDNRRIMAHRVILSGASEYFAAMFTGSLREAGEKEVTLKGFDGDILKSLVEYCYTGILNCDISNFEALFAAANMLQLWSAVEWCRDFIFSQLNHINCLGFQAFAEQYSNQSLLKSTTEYACFHFEEVSKSEEFFELSAGRLKCLLENDNIKVTSEESVFYAIKSWVEHDASNRSKEIRNLLNSVRLSLVSPSFIVDQMEKFCKTVDGCKEILYEGLKYHLRERCSNYPRPRNHNSNFYIISVDGITPIEINYFCPSKRVWKFLRNLPTDNENFAVAFDNYDKLIFYVLNQTNNCASNKSRCMTLDLKSMVCTVNIFDGALQTFTFSLSVIFNERLYVIGIDYSRENIIVQRWDFSSKSWTICGENENIHGSNFCAVIFSDTIYITGGTDRWGRSLLESAVLDGFLYAIGGTQNKTVERCNLNTYNWTSIASLRYPYNKIYSTVLENRLIVMGFWNRKKIVEEYNPSTNNWSILSDANDENQQCKGIFTIPSYFVTN